MMEAMILLLGQQMSVSAAARHLGESDTTALESAGTLCHGGPCRQGLEPGAPSDD